MSSRRPARQKSKYKMLDLHAVKVMDVYDKVDKFIHKSSTSGLSKVAIMTGKGTGAVKKEVIQYLKQAGYPWSYDTTPSGTKNEGILVIHLD